ncbi:MAG: hypothetical protein R3F43_12320 [bacterium]
MFRPEQLDLVGRLAGNIALGCFASRSYVDAHGVPASLDEASARPRHHRLRPQRLGRARLPVPWIPG